MSIAIPPGNEVRPRAYGRALPWLVIVTLYVAVPTARGDQSDSYLRDVKPVLQKRCFACHGAIKQESDLRLDTGLSIKQGANSGPVIELGQSAQSLLIQRITSTDESLRMPPEGAPLSAEEVASLAAWIDAGAHTPAGEQPEKDPRQHWSFRPPVRSPVPPATSEWSKNPIDSFVSAGHRERGLVPLPEADKATLLRRVYFDLIGLPPTRAELHAFLADDSPTAYESVVDRLLADSRYGERWARHWMDVWRYSDWYGRRSVPDVMNSYPQIWRWRDWIVTSLNDDKGYDQMIIEMLAADEAAPGDDSRVVATGFIVRNWFKWNYETWMKDNVEHTAKAFLGITMNCCHCHDHKYDPISQEEYFRFRAFFEPLELRQDRVAGLPDPGPFQKYDYSKSYGPIAAGLIRVFDEKLDAKTFQYVKGDSRNRMADKPPVDPGVPAALGNLEFQVEPVALPPEAYYPGLKSFIRAEEMAKRDADLKEARQQLASSAATLVAATEHRDKLRLHDDPQPPDPAALLLAEHSYLQARLAQGAAEQQVAWASAEQRSLTARIAADDAKYRGIGDPSALSRVAFLAEKQADYEKTLLRLTRAEQSLLAANLKVAADPQSKPEAEKAQKEMSDARAALDAARSTVATTGEDYSLLSPIYPATTTGRRLALAKWIASTKNPLTARVAVNHMWLRHFGRGLVDTPSNFGRSGHPPSHPELLDWLAVELMASKWQMKPLHRLLVTSRAYRSQSSPGTVTHPNLEKDRDNCWYWRANPRRLEAEAVRDAVLACAEELDTTSGGQEIDLAQGATSGRRSLYFASHGEARMPFLELFDAPDVCDGYERVASVRPQQALALANSDLSLRHARLLAGKLWRQAESLSTDSNERQLTFIRSAFEQVLSRPAKENEMIATREFLGEQLRILASASPDQLAATSPKDVPPPAAEPAQRARESLIHALFNHNDFVTVR